MDPSSLLRNARQKWVSRCWAWGDGIPVNWDRTESIETIALSFPGLKSSHASCRIPLVGLSKKQCCEETWIDVFNVLQWSLQHAATGCYPLSRHDADAWKMSRGKNDKLRAKQSWHIFGSQRHRRRDARRLGVCAASPAGTPRISATMPLRPKDVPAFLARSLSFLPRLIFHASAS